MSLDSVILTFNGVLNRIHEWRIAISPRNYTSSFLRMRFNVAAELPPSYVSAILQRSKSANLMPSRSRYEVSSSPLSFDASAST
jgi:hypothetical protein